MSSCKEGERAEERRQVRADFFGFIAFDGNGAPLVVWQAINPSVGGYDDGNGMLKLNTPENVAGRLAARDGAEGLRAGDRLRRRFPGRGGVQDGLAGAFSTGLFGYRYLLLLTAPSGTKYEKKNENEDIRRY